MSKKAREVQPFDITPFYNPIIFIECVLLNGKRKLYDYQRHWITKFCEHGLNNTKDIENAKKFYNMVNKTRQCGYSTIYKYIVLYFCIMHKNQSFFIFSKSNTASKTFLRDIKDMYLKIDKKKYGIFKKPLMVDNKNEMIFFDKDGASGNLIQALSVSSGIRSMDSGKNLHVCIDEMSFIPDGELGVLIHGVEPMYSFIKQYPFSSLTFISTPLLTDSLFYKYWSDTDPNLVKIKIMWYEIEDRYLKTGITTKIVREYIRKKPDTTQEELVNLFAKKFLIDIYKRDKDVFLSEYACEFLDLQGCFIDGKLIDACLKYDNEYLNYETEDLLMYAKARYGDGGILITGYDPSLGKEKSDKCMITTFYYLEETNMFYQLAAQQLKMPTPEQRKFIGKFLIEKYGDEHILAIDTGGIGGSILQELEYAYANYNILGIAPTNPNRNKGFINMKHLITNKNFEFCNDINIKKDIKMIRQEKGLTTTKFVLERDKKDEKNKNSHADLAYAIMLVNLCVYIYKEKGLELKKNNNDFGLESWDLDEFF